MKNLFSYSSYKDVLRDSLHSKDSPRGQQSRLARHLGCQSAYLYQVLKGKAELTEDQAFKVTTFYNFKKTESEYFMLLARFSRATTPDLKTYLKKELKERVSFESDLKNKSDAAEAPDDHQMMQYYFSSTLPSLIHIMTSSEKFRGAETLAKKLNVPVAMVEHHLKKLLSFGFVTFKNGKWFHATPSLHFDKDSSYNLSFQTMRRTQALSSILSQKKDGNTHFSSLFTLDKKNYELLRAQAAEFVQKSQKTIHAGGTDDPYIFCIDLFEL